MSRTSKILPVLGYILWAASIPATYWADVKLGIWNLDVFTAGVSAGMLLAIMAGKLIVAVEITANDLDRQNTHLKQLLWRIEGVKRRIRKLRDL